MLTKEEEEEEEEEEDEEEEEELCLRSDILLINYVFE